MFTSLSPEMMGVTNKIAAPTVLVDSRIPKAFGEVGFEFEAFHDTLRSAGVTSEQIVTNTIRFAIGDGTNLGLYVSKLRRTDIYVNVCKDAASTVGEGEPTRQPHGYVPISPDMGVLVNDVTVHETGHFVHDALHPSYASRMQALKLGAAATVLSPVAMLVDVMQQGPYYEAAPAGIGVAAAIIVVGGVIASRYNPLERPAFRFQEQYGDQQFVTFAAKSGPSE